MFLFTPTSLKQLCSKYGLIPSRKYGQNFLINPKPIEKMIEAAGITKSDTVIEVGPGFGVLTFALAEKAKKVIAFEIEKKLQNYWSENKPENVEIVWGNALRVIASEPQASEAIPRYGSAHQAGSESIGIAASLPAVAPRNDTEISSLPRHQYKVVANLPYQITSNLIRTFLETENQPQLMVLMVQKEVAQRICAKPGDMSLLAVSVQYYAQPEIVLQVPRTYFWPEPEVDSAIIRVSLRAPHNAGRGNPSDKRPANLVGTSEQKDCVVVRSPWGDLPPRNDTKTFFRIVRAGFAQKRKLLIKNLEPIVGKQNRGMLQNVFNEIGLLPTARAQELGVRGWKELVEKISKHILSS